MTGVYLKRKTPGWQFWGVEGYIKEVNTRLFSRLHREAGTGWIPRSGDLSLLWASVWHEQCLLVFTVFANLTLLWFSVILAARNAMGASGQLRNMVCWMPGDTLHYCGCPLKRGSVSCPA